MVSALLRLADDNSLVNGDGKTVVLKGTALGGIQSKLYVLITGWMNMENFITGYPSREFQIREELLKVLGKEKYNIFFDSVCSHVHYFLIIPVPNQLLHGIRCQVPQSLWCQCASSSLQLQPLPDHSQTTIPLPHQRRRLQTSRQGSRTLCLSRNLHNFRSPRCSRRSKHRLAF